MGVTVLLLTLVWWRYATDFYDRVLPFYDSASYQQGYQVVAKIASERGVLETLVLVWTEPASNVVLYRFFAALVGPSLPLAREGLYVYLFGWHLLAAITVAYVVKALTGKFFPAFAAVATWLTTAPFFILRDGIGDQRLDLSSGSAFLIITALALLFANHPSARIACIIGTASAFAVLHRPILLPAIVIVAMALVINALRQGRQPIKMWIAPVILGIAPFAVLAAPWLLMHQQELRSYYLEYGTAVNADVSLMEAAKFNWLHFQSAFGSTALLVLLLGLSYLARGVQIHPQTLLLVVVAWCAPIAVLIFSKSVGNTYVQQIALGIPVLIFASLRPSHRAHLADVTPAMLMMLIPLAAATVNLELSIAQESKHERKEVEQMLKQMSVPSSGARLAGFHDLPLSPVSLSMVAEQMRIPLHVGTIAYYPGDFGLTNDYLSDTGSDVTKEAVADKLREIRHGNDLLIVPSEESVARLWMGLYSHRLLPLIRDLIKRDPSFQFEGSVGPVKKVYFDIYRISPDPS